MSDLIHIHTASDKLIAELVKGFLKSNGIESLIRPAYIGLQGVVVPGTGGPVISGPWRVYVFKNKEEKAKKMLKNFNDGKK